MKTDIQPKYKEATVTCACGNTFRTGSVKENLKVEVYSQCHPFFIGKQKFSDQGRRIEEFNRKYKRD